MAVKDGERGATCRLYVLLARDVETAVIFRKGPRNNTLLVKWDLRHDIFDEGQWVTHKIYVRRCDLSPDGNHLVYFAANFRRPNQIVWTAISRPPFFTALAMWRQLGTYGGGGIFEDRRALLLNHREVYAKLADGFSVPSRLSVYASEKHPGGEIGPTEFERLRRGGWFPIQHGDFRFGARRPNPRHDTITLRRIGIEGNMRKGKFYAEDFIVSDEDGTDLRAFNDLDWADWDRNGDLLIADGGKVWRLAAKHVRKGTKDPYADAKLLIDLSDRTFEAIETPEWAKHWGTF